MGIFSHYEEDRNNRAFCSRDNEFAVNKTRDLQKAAADRNKARQFKPRFRKVTFFCSMRRQRKKVD